MLRTISIAIVICISAGLVLSACQKEDATVDYRNEYIATTDYPYTFQQQGKGNIVAPTEDGYYFLNDSLIYYADRSTMKPVLLDKRPENDCLAPSEQGEVHNCYAYVKHNELFPNHFLNYYNGKLYVLESGEVWSKDNENRFKTMLIELNKDGSGRKVKMTFDSVPKSMAIHRGMLYYSLRTADSNAIGSSNLLQASLNNLSKPQSIYESADKKSKVTDIIPYGKNIYFYEFADDKPVKFKRYDIEDGTVSELYTNTDADISSIQGIDGKQLIYKSNPRNSTDEMLRDKKLAKVFSSDLEGNRNEELPLERDFRSYYYVDNQFYYARPTYGPLLAIGWKERFTDIRHELTVYDKQYRALDVIDLSFLPMEHILMTGDDHYMFAQFRNEDEMHMYVLDKSEIVTGIASFKSLFASPILR